MKGVFREYFFTKNNFIVFGELIDELMLQYYAAKGPTINLPTVILITLGGVYGRGEASQV